MLRRTFTLASVAGLTAGLTGLSPDTRDHVSGRARRGAVDMRAVQEIRSIGASLRRTYASTPAPALLPVAHHQIELALALRPKGQPSAQRIALLEHMAEMAALAGGILTLDLHRFEEAAAYMDLAYQLAAEVGSAEISAMILGGRAFMAAHHDHDAGEALDYALAAVDHAERGASTRMTAWTHAVASEMAAGTGDEAGFRESLERARTLLSGPVDDDHRFGGFSWFTMAKADGYEGGDLVRLARWREALPALDHALDTIPQEQVRHRGTALISRAEAYAGAGDIEAACADAHAALAIVETIQHRDTLRRVAELQRKLRQKPSPQVRALGEHVLDARLIVKSAGAAAC